MPQAAPEWSGGYAPAERSVGDVHREPDHAGHSRTPDGTEAQDEELVAPYGSHRPSLMLPRIEIRAPCAGGVPAVIAAVRYRRTVAGRDVSVSASNRAGGSSARATCSSRSHSEVTG